ncbi:MAG TPA: hypothetical protein VHG53_05585 [Candidatus Limnocylindria bacterium]|nr:hypothetical protein [Candidatus Limnocylindria bacterium]
MPPALVPLVLIAIGAPAAVRAGLGRPRGMAAAWLLSVAGVLVAQGIGEVAGSCIGTIGEAHVLFACCGAALASLGAAGLERLRG